MKKQIDCSQIKGANYTPSYACNDIEEWRDYDPDVVERELGYAKRLGMNSVRVFLQYAVYAHDREIFLQNLLHMVRTAASFDMTVMPVVFDSCFSLKEPVIDFDRNEWIPNPGAMHLDASFWKRGEAYCLDLIRLLQTEKGLLMWDIMNEPLCTDYFYGVQGEVRQRHKEEIYAFLKHFCDFFHEHDDINPITVGHDGVDRNDETGDWVDILSYHNYLPTEKGIQDVHDQALAQGKKFNKQVFCSEAGCPARANPYDITIEFLNRNQTGYFLWELMIGKSFWNDRHGIVYADGTIRDASIVAALNGFFRRREDRLPYVADTEQCVSDAITRIRKWLSDDADIAEGLEIVNRAAHILESNLLLPESDLPTADFYALRKKEDLTRADIAAKLVAWLPALESAVRK